MYLLRWFLYVYSTSLIILVSFLFIKRKEIDISRKIKGAFIPISNTILVLFLIVDLIICVFKRRERKTEIINEVYLDDKSFQKFTQEFETINSSINSWRTLLLAMENNTPEYREKLKYFHFQINFIALNIHRKNDPGWFSDIPFETPSEETIDKASAYSRSTKIPGVPDILGMTNVTEYRANKETGIQRFSDSNVDLYIVSVAECLKHHGNIQGAESISTACFEAIEHYASLPVVR